MNRDLTELLACPDCSSAALSLEDYAANEQAVDEGRLTCGGCGRWFRIEKGVADLLPAHLRRRDLDAEFARRHNLPDNPPAPGPAEGFKASQIDFFKSHATDYEKSIVKHPLYTAFNDAGLLKWARSKLTAGQRVLDLGCGTGEPCLDLAGLGLRVVGVDIAEEMLAVGQQKAGEKGLASRVDFVAGDAESPPVRDAAFDACVLLGTLHHLPSPAEGVAAAARKLKTPGHFYSQDPHNSPLRFLFDWLMKLRKIYDEEARDEPLLTGPQLGGWMAAAGLSGQTRLSIYLPPHAFGFCSPAGAGRLLRATDAAFGALPGVRRWAGYVIAEAVKTDGGSAPATAESPAGMDYETAWQGGWNDTTRYGPACRHRRRIVAHLVKRLPHESVLDLGCGDGSLLAEISRKVKGRLVGSDISAEAVRIAAGRCPGLEFIQMDLAKDLPADRFDTVVMSEVLEHIEDDAAALRRIADIARYVVISVPGGPAGKVDRRFGHFRNYEGDALPRLLESCGYDVVYFRRWGFPFHQLTQRLLASRGDAPALAGGRYTPAKKLAATALYLLFFLNVLPRGAQVFAIGRSRT